MSNNALSNELRKEIEDDIKNNKVVVFMKGSLAQPQCGFSANLAKILKSYDIQIKEHNVLARPELREGIKLFTDWPTIPQIFINGEFIGGNDILTQMHEEGELAKILVSADPA
jgi:monothiol glutaredoxin